MLAGEIQPGGRAPAPGDLALVQAFLNTHYDLEHEHGAEVFSSPGALAEWLTARGLARAGTAKEADLRRALRTRDALRALARGNGTAAALDRAARGAVVGIGFAAGGPRFHNPGGSVAGALGVLLAITALAMGDGTWSRLKVCPGHDCDWAFYDHSRNGSGRWCSMSVCGGRAKARAHYRRQRGEAD